MVISELIIFPKEINLSILIEVVKEVALRGLKIHTHTQTHNYTHTHILTNTHMHTNMNTNIHITFLYSVKESHIERGKHTENKSIFYLWLPLSDRIMDRIKFSRFIKLPSINMCSFSLVNKNMLPQNFT